MDPNTFSNKGYFDNWNEMYEAYFGVDPMGIFANKVEAPYLTTTTGIRNIIYGAWLTTIFVTTHNGLGAMRDAPWRKSGYRVIKDSYFGSTPTADGVTQGGAIPSSVQDTLDVLEFQPKTLANVLDISTAELAMEGRDDVAKWAELVDARRKIMMNAWDRAFLMRASKSARSADKHLCPLDAIIASYDQYTNSGESPTSGCFTVGGQTRQSAASAFDAYVSHNAGTARTFAMKYMDDLVIACQPYWDDGSFENKHWLTGVDTAGRIQQLIMAQYRGKLDSAPVQYTVGGIKTLPGQPGLTLVNLYDNMPIIVDKFTDATYGSATKGIGKVYLIDDNYMEIAIGQPIEYQESKEYLATGYLAKRGIFHAVMESVAWNFGCHGKLMDIK